MAKFAQYYIRYYHELAPYDWDERQQFLGTFFEKDDSIEFSVGEDESKKIFKHRVYHLQNNRNIIVMQFANAIDIPVEINYEQTTAKDEPSCFVIIDNRDNLRTVAIQKRKKAFGEPGQVAKILTKNIDRQLFNTKCYKMDILPEYYPEDLFKAWEILQRNAQSLRFAVPEMSIEEIQQKIEELKTKNKEYFDDSLIAPILQLALEAKKAKYKQLCTVMPEDKKNALYVDKSSVYMKNLITMSSALDMPIEIVTNDAGTFKCFVESDTENIDKIVQREFDASLLEKLFSKADKDGNKVEEDEIVKIEGEIVEMLNKMKHESDDVMGEKVA